MAKSNFIVRGGADFSGIKREMQKTQSAMAGFQASISRSMATVGKILGSLAVGKLIKDSTAAAMGVESAMDNINRNMGSSAKVFQEWVNTQSKALGMGKAEAYKYGSTFSNLLGSFQNDSKQTSDSTQELMKAAAIISSKTGRTYEGTANRIRSGMLGSTEAIEDLGVYTNISMIESTEAFKKFAGSKSWAQLDFQTQQQIRLAAILEQTYARYGNTLADTTTTRQNQFIASLKNAQLSLGQAFLPIYNSVLPALTRMADAIGDVINKIAQFSQALFGKANVGTTQNTEEQAAAVAGLGDATEAAGKQAKKAQSALAGFDELNVLSKADGADGGLESGLKGMPDITTGGEIGSGLTVSPAVQTAVDTLMKILEPLKVINFDNLSNAFDRLKKAVEPITKTIFAGLEWAYINLFVPLATWVIEDALPAWLDAFSSQLNFLNSVIEALKPLGIWLWDVFLKPFLSWAGDRYIDWLNLLSSGFNKISDWITKHKTLVQDIIIVIGSFAAAWGLVNLAIGLWNTIGVIATAVTTAFSAAVAFLTSPIGLVVIAVGILIAIVVLLIKHWDDVKIAASKAWGWIKETWNAAGEWFKTTVIEPVKAFFSELWDNIKLKASEAWNGIKAIWQGVSSWFNTTVISPVSTIFSSLRDSIKTALNTAWTWVTDTWKGAGSWFKQIGEDMFNGMWDGLKSVWDKITGWITETVDWLKDKLSFWKDSLTGSSSGGGSAGGVSGGGSGPGSDYQKNKQAEISANKDEISAISKVKDVDMDTAYSMWKATNIPKLATGAVIPPNSEFLAILGDQKSGRNIEAPEGLIRQIIKEELSGLNIGGQELTINFGGSMAQFVRMLKPYIDKENSRVGTKLVIGGAQ